MRTLKGRWLASGLLAFVAGGCNLVFGLEHHELDQGRGGAGGGGGAFCSVDAIKNGDETDKDCGGSTCPACADGQRCTVGADCQSQVCNDGICLVPACDDKVKNGLETDVDCGASCPKCGPAKSCGEDKDCKSNACAGGACTSTCTDALQGGAETDVDCGGGAVSNCPTCAIGKSCNINVDCQGGECATGICVDFHVWDKHIITSNPFYQVDPSAVSTDLQGNVFLATDLTGAASYDGTTFTGLGSWDIVLSKLDSEGKYVWQRQFGDSQDQGTRGLAADAQGSVLMTGEFHGEVDFTNGNNPLSHVGNADVFLVKISDSGATQWDKGFGKAGTQTSGGVAVDGTNNVLVTGGFDTAISFDGAASTTAGGSDAFIVKFGPAGTYQWSHTFGDAQNQRGTGVATDAAGNVFVVGELQGTIDIGAGSPITNVGGGDVFLAKFDSTGKPLWSSHFGSDKASASAGGGSVAVDGAGNVLVAGYFDDTIDFGSGPLATAGGRDMFVAKFSSAGKLGWSKSFGGVGPTSIAGASIAVDKAGGITLFGNFSSSIDLGGGPLTSDGSNDIFVAKLDAAGSYLWARSFGDMGLQAAGRGCVGLIGATNIVVAGSFQNTIDLGGGPLTSSGGRDAFLARLRTP
jgi:hypothetical protein